MNSRSLVHKTCCEKCPSNQCKVQGLIDPESQDMKDNWGVEAHTKDCLFSCAWRPNKLCRGNVDFFELDEAQLRNAGWHNCPDCGRASLEACYSCNTIPDPLQLLNY